MSTPLSEDANFAYRRLWSKARALGSISRSFEALAHDVSASYYAALSRPAPEAWTALAVRSDSLVQRAHALSEILTLDREEREALAFFEAIVRENADLLERPAAQG